MVKNNMRAILLTGHGGMDKLKYVEDYPAPTIDENEVLVAVKAAGLNNTDVNTRIGWYSKAVTGATDDKDIAKKDVSDDATWGGNKLTFPVIQGGDVVGIVVKQGKNVKGDFINKRVLICPWLRDWDNPDVLDDISYFSSECNGGFAEYTKVHYKNAHIIDSPLSDAELASFPTAYITAENMISKANVKENENVLITGASGGVGSALIQLVRRRGATAIAVTSPHKRQLLHDIGASYTLDRGADNLLAELHKIINIQAVDVVADIVGGDKWSYLLDMLRRGGRYVCSGAIAGPMVELDLRTLYLKDLQFHGATFGGPDIFQNLVSYIEKGEVKPLLHKTWDLKDFKLAQTEFLKKSHIGNIVVTV